MFTLIIYSWLTQTVVVVPMIYPTLGMCKAVGEIARTAKDVSSYVCIPGGTPR